MRCVGRSCRVGCEISSSIARHVIFLEKAEIAINERKTRVTPQLISNATSCANLREKNHKFPLSLRGCKLRYVYDGKFPRTTFLLCMAARDVGAEFAGSEHEKRNSIFFADSKKSDTN